MRFVRRDDSRTSCLVLLRFDTAATAAAFHQERNNKPVGLHLEQCQCMHMTLAVCLAALKPFRQQYDDVNVSIMLQFWTLEPDVICRLVFVKDIQYDEGSGGGAAAAAAAAAAVEARDGSPGASSSSAGRSAAGSGPQLPAPGQTELPTCPVCLERLDTHISGIVTTVG